MNGHLFNVVLWFQNVLIMITLIFLIIIFLFKKTYFFVFHILNIISYITIYSGFNYDFFYKNFSYETASTIGRVAEVFPLALTGFLFASLNIKEKLNKYKQKTEFFCITILIMITKYNIFTNIKNFKYGSVKNNIAAACIFIIFLFFPEEIIKNKTINIIIIQMTSYTSGIYFTHILIGRGKIISKIIKPIKKKTLFGCFITYLICYIISFFGKKIVGKNKFKHLFI